MLDHLPGNGERLRCAACGNLTRFDVVANRRTTAFWHYTVAGKTTTILMLLGLTEPSDGEAWVVGLDPARNPLEVK
ncbi:MAG TPA: hypothetical protein VJ931_07965, partial [Actinomycetota bacterium]|nr:hypothetical protein [Actinomycetota bacterium]